MDQTPAENRAKIRHRDSSTRCGHILFLSRVQHHPLLTLTVKYVFRNMTMPGNAFDLRMGCILFLQFVLVLEVGSLTETSLSESRECYERRLKYSGKSSGLTNHS